MNRSSRILMYVVGTGMMASNFVSAQPDSAVDLNCNQLGRELALRSVEELGLGIDASKRAELAGLAEMICLDFQVLVPVSSVGVYPDGGLQDDGSTRLDASFEANQGSSADDKGFFKLEKIAPEDRVRRPGLKRL